MAGVLSRDRLSMTIISASVCATEALASASAIESRQPAMACALFLVQRMIESFMPYVSLTCRKREPFDIAATPLRDRLTALPRCSSADRPFGCNLLSLTSRRLHLQRVCRCSRTTIRVSI